jgi:hypothetical protein
MNNLLYLITIFLLILVTYSFYKKTTPQFFFSRVYRKVTFKKRRNFSMSQNISAIKKIKNLKTINFEKLSDIECFYSLSIINNRSLKNHKLSVLNIKNIKNILIEKCFFNSHDGVKVFFYRIQKNTSKRNKKPIVMFSGHGTARDLVYGKNIIDFFADEDFESFDTYQSKAAIKLVNSTNVIYVMENRGMGEMQFLGNIKEIDSVYRLSGGSLMGVWLSDAILISKIVSNIHESKISVCGISTGGFLSLFSSLFNDVDTVICQGYLSSFQDSFIHDKSSINRIHNLSKYNFYSISKFFKNKKIIFINGQNDNFDPKEAEKEFIKMQNINKKANIFFVSPKNLGHKIDPKLLKKYLN